MLRVDDYHPLHSVTSAYSDDPEDHDADITRPLLLPPGATRAALVSSLSEESQLKQQAYTGHFIQHLVRFTMSSVAFGLSLATAVLSGSAVIPLAVVTGTAMIIAAGDACCALYSLIQVRNGREPLTGNDSITLAVKRLMMTCGMRELDAETVGDAASCALRTGITLSSIFLPAAHLSEDTANLLSEISAGITAVLTMAGGGIDMYTKRVERMQKSIAMSANPAFAAAGVCEDEDSDKPGQEELRRIVDSVVACFERYQAQLQASTVSPGPA